MVDLQQGTDRTNISLPVYKVSSKNTSSRKDFNFLDGKGSKKCEDDADLQSSQIEFQTERGDYSAYSPPLWASTSNVNTNLLSHNHYYSSPFSTSWLQVIQDGRKEVMEMTRGLPESSSELSLQDIVDDEIRIKEVEQDMVKKIERKNIKSTVKRQISKSQSMNNEGFLLKMFLPSCCLSCKKKTTLGNQSKVSRMPSFDGYEKPMDKERWSISYFVLRRNRSNSAGSSSSRSSSGSTGCNSSSRSRNDFIKFLFRKSKCKSTSLIPDKLHLESK